MRVYRGASCPPSFPGSPGLLLLGCFFLSGGAALLYEVSWLRLLVLVFGTTGFAVATVLTAFMAGLGLGSYAFGRLVDRWLRPVLLYGLLEAGIGAYALAVPGLFDGLVPIYRWAWERFHPSFFAFSLVRFGLAFLILLVPTTLMGGTLPVLSRFFTRGGEEVGFRVGGLYALNTLGSAAGSFATGFFVLSALGLRDTQRLGVAINALVAAVAFALAARFQEKRAPLRGESLGDLREGRRAGLARRELPAKKRTPGERAGWERAILLVFGLSGFLAMAYEVAWTRLLTLVLGSSTYSFTIMVTTFILGIALGSALMARPADRIHSPLIAFGLVELGIGLTTFLGLLLAHRLPSWFLWLFQWTGGRSPLFVIAQFSLAGLVMLVPTLLMGAAFPLVIRLLARDVSFLGRLVGKAYAVNTLGAVLGAFGAGFFLLPAVGIQQTILIGLVLNLLVGIALVGLAPGRTTGWRLAWVGAGLIAMLVAAGRPPKWDRLVMSSGVYREAPLLLSLYGSPAEALRLLGNFDLLYYREGVTATVTVVERPILADRRHLALAIDGKVDASTAEDMATQVLSAHLPLMLALRLERVLVVGWGSGVTAGSAALYPVRELVGIEIEPAVVEGSRAFDDVNHRPLDDPRLRLVLEDGRNYLLVAPDTFDVIISEPSNPWMSGPAKLFTREFFELGAAHLAPDGIFCQWLQLYGIEPASLRALIRTFQSVFPHSYLVRTAPADLLILGSRVPLRLEVPSLRRWFAEPRIAGDLARVGVREPADLVARFLAGPKEVSSLSGDGPPNTDDNGLIEFAAPRALYKETIESNLEMIRRSSGGVGAYLADFENRRDEAEFLARLGERLLSAGDGDAAVDAIRQAVDLEPSARAYQVLGEALARRGDWAGAVDAWARALRLEPDHVPTLLSRARWSLERGVRREALADLSRATRADPQNRAAWSLQALVAHTEGLHREAREALVRSEGLDVGEGFEQLFRPYLAYRLRGEGTGGNGGQDQALAAFVRKLREWREEAHWETPSPERGAVDSLWTFAGQFFPGDVYLQRLVEAEILRPLTAFYTGVNAYLLGFYPRAIELLSALQREIDGSLPLVYYTLGLAHLRSGNRGVAADALSRFVEAVPPERRQGASYPDARRRLGELTGKMRQPEERDRDGRGHVSRIPVRRARRAPPL